ncbi:MAG: aminotransferase class III-fold pyridoxal phosphate-dependent enzyme [Polyangiaceae bacterium]|jgi:acetylornithine/succinyldiaminopimelate/putrescine aminotransferase/predicted amino acid dehydrogenase|nr:aminotransferase class III-fold pyridoxal phosphate-dependent enzyme [Polyangiaceae bacterium]
MFLNRFREELLSKLKLNPEIVKARGNRLTLADGREVRDFLAQYGALPFGHNPPFAVEAVQRHLAESQPVFIQPTIHRKALALARRLNEALGNHFPYCTLANSGAEAVEAAIKLARLRTDRAHILAARKGYHGKTFAALSATGSERYKSAHIHDETRFQHVPFNDMNALEEALATGKFAAFLVEPVQGEGGMNVATTEYLRAAEELCRKHGTLLVFDEVQTGLGRTGHLTAAQAHRVVPDILLLSKALGAGLVPVGAVLYREHVHTFEFDRKHSSTFASNGLAATAGLAVLDRLLADDGAALAHVRELSARIDQRCAALAAEHPQRFEHRGAGLMRALTLRDPSAQQNVIAAFALNSGALAYIVCGYLLERYGIFTMPLLSEPCAIRFEPPLDVEPRDIDDFFDALGGVLALLESGRYDRLMAFLIGKNEESMSPPSHRYTVSGDGPVAPARRDDQERARGKRFAFLMHATSISDVMRALPEAILREYSHLERQALAGWICEVGAIDHEPEVGGVFSVRSRGAVSEGMLIFSPLLPGDMMALSTTEKRNLMRDYLKVARREGIEVVGLGAYTSVISGGGDAIAREASDLTLTTGNSLTAVSTLRSVESIFGPQASKHTAAVIGARGSVGRLVAVGLAHSFGGLVLLGRPGTEDALLRDVLPELLRVALTTEQPVAPGSVLARLASWLGPEARGFASDPRWLSEAAARLSPAERASLGLRIEHDPTEVLPAVDCVVSVTSEGKPFLQSSLLRPGAVAFDTARPFDFIRNERCAARIHEGGLVQQPEPLLYTDRNMIEAPAGVNLACLTETIVLALDRAEGHHSMGKHIPFEAAVGIAETARRHGFTPVTYPPLHEAAAEPETALPPRLASSNPLAASP